MKSLTVPILISCTGCDPVSAVVTILVFEKRQRVLRALTALFAFWVGALIAVLIPVAHFFLVPLFSVLGPIAAWISFGKAFRIEGAELLCPNCGASHAVHPEPAAWPIRETCQSCRYRLVLTPRDAP